MLFWLRAARHLVIYVFNFSKPPSPIGVPKQGEIFFITVRLKAFTCAGPWQSQREP